MANFDKSEVSPLTSNGTVKIIDGVPAATQEALLLSILVQQSDNYELLMAISNKLETLNERVTIIEEYVEEVHHELTATTISDKDGVRGVDRHTESVFVAPNDPRNPKTVKDFLALIKTEVRHSDDCGYDRLCRDKPWALLLVVEQFGRDDLDGNGLIFGHNFIFSNPHEEWPPVLQDAVGFDDYSVWPGNRLSFAQYRDGLPAGSAFRAHVGDWIDLVG